MEKCDRLKWARERVFQGKVTPAAKKFDFVVSTYTSHENGTRDFDNEEAARYARRFNVSLCWLVFGIGKPTEFKEPDPALPWAQWEELSPQNRQTVVDLITNLFNRQKTPQNPVENRPSGGFVTGEQQIATPSLASGSVGRIRKPKGS